MTFLDVMAVVSVMQPIYLVLLSFALVIALVDSIIGWVSRPWPSGDDD